LCIATHNEKSIDFAQFLMSEKRIHRKLDGITFAQLLGIKTQLSAELVSEEFIVQKYTPFGPFNKLIPYLLRRAQEQKDMLSELNDQIDMIFKELNFRANK
jgi:Proline dehydrogenase.